MRNCCEIGVENASFVDGFAVAVDSSGRVESAGELVLCTRGQAALILDDNDLVLV
jgi:hypothetical protein